MPHTEVILACLNNFYPTCSVEESPVHGCGEERLQGINACCPRGSKEHTCDNMCFICTSGDIGGMWPIMPRGLLYVGVVPAMLL